MSGLSSFMRVCIHVEFSPGLVFPLRHCQSLASCSPMTVMNSNDLIAAFREAVNPRLRLNRHRIHSVWLQRLVNLVACSCRMIRTILGKGGDFLHWLKTRSRPRLSCRCGTSHSPHEIHKRRHDLLKRPLWAVAERSSIRMPRKRLPHGCSRTSVVQGQHQSTAAKNALAVIGKYPWEP